jgi:hypothetical protein
MRIWIFSMVSLLAITGCQSVEQDDRSTDDTDSDTSTEASEELFSCDWVCAEKLACLQQDPWFEDHIADHPDWLDEKGDICSEYCQQSLTEGASMTKIHHHCVELGWEEDPEDEICLEWADDLVQEWFFDGERLGQFVECIREWNETYARMGCDGGEDEDWTYFAVVYAVNGAAHEGFEACKADLIEGAEGLVWDGDTWLPPLEPDGDWADYRYRFDFFLWLVNPPLLGSDAGDIF